jgi:hypothetical protein
VTNVARAPPRPLNGITLSSLDRTMDDPRRVKVPWHSWRWRLALLLPMLLFALLAANSLREIRTEPVLSIVFSALFLAFALLFARQVWRERHPLRSEVRSPTGQAG